jgi:hypothetical protein
MPGRQCQTRSSAGFCGSFGKILRLLVNRDRAKTFNGEINTLRGWHRQLETSCLCGNTTRAAC